MKKNLKKVFFIVGFMLTTIVLQAQLLPEELTVPKPLVLLPSPQTQMFEQYLNHTIDECTGLPDISIPLYEIEIKGLKIPIVLSYHASGVKYDQQDGDLGVGWSINAGGYRVSRTVYGRPDEGYPMYSETDYLSMSGSTQSNPVTCAYFASMGASYGDALQMVRVPYGRGVIPFDIQDGEYDQFRYMLPSGSGNFIITQRNPIQCASIEGKPDKINIRTEYVPYSTSMTGMTITDGSGITYYFGESNVLRESVFHEDFFCNTAWALHKLVMPYNDSINFSYTQDIMETPPFRTNSPSSLIIKDAGIWTPYTDMLNSEYQYDVEKSEMPSHQTFFVSKIESAKEIVEFERYGSNSILNIPKYSIKTITVKDKGGNIIKKISFEYESRNLNRWHTLLKAIRIGSGNQDEKTYAFGYYQPTNMKFENVYPDQWGYYSGTRVADTSTPGKGLAVDNVFKNDQVVFHFSPYQTVVRTLGTLHSSDLAYLWFDRTENKGLQHIFSLKTIKYPTGGKTEYEYEPHQHHTPGRVVTGGGQRIKSIKLRPDTGKPPVISQFKYGENEDGIGYANIALTKYFWASEFRYFNESIDSLGGLNYYLSIHPIRIYHVNSPFPEMSRFQIRYEQVSIYQYDSIQHQYNGKTVSMYELPVEFEVGAYPVTQTDLNQLNIPFNNYRVRFGAYRPGHQARLMCRKTYSEQRLVQVDSMAYHWSSNSSTEYKGLKVVHKNIFRPHEWPVTLHQIGGNPGYWLDDFFAHANYTVYAGTNNLLASKSTTIYDDVGNSVWSKEKYTYNGHQQLSTIINTGSNKELLVKKIYYADDYPGSLPIRTAMLNANMQSQVVQTQTIFNGREIGTVKTNYTNDPNITYGLILPQSVETTGTDGNGLRTDLTYNKYDAKGNLLQYTINNVLPVSYLWSYNGQYPVAEIRNASYSQIQSALPGFNPDVLSEKYEPSTSDMNTIRSLRIKLPNAQVRVFTYQPLVGVTSETDPSGRTIYYQYDNFNRLKETYIIENDVKKILQSNFYHYQNN